MQRKKIATILAIALLMLALPAFSIPKAQAWHDNDEVELTGVQNYTNDRLFGSVVSAREGSIVTFRVLVQASSLATPNTGQRNVTVGVKFDWMTAYQNATNANPASTLLVTPNQDVTVTVAVTLPPLSGNTAGYNLYEHTWTVLVASGPLNTVVTDCGHSGLKGCTTPGGGGFVIYSPDQADGNAAKEEAQDKIDTLSPRLALPILANSPPGWSKAVADLSQAEAAIARGDTYYESHDFAAARGQYQSALGSVNSAAGALGGGESGTYFSSWFGGVGWLLIGVAALLLGLGGFTYLRRRK